MLGIGCCGDVSVDNCKIHIWQRGNHLKKFDFIVPLLVELFRDSRYGHKFECLYPELQRLEVMTRSRQEVTFGR